MKSVDEVADIMYKTVKEADGVKRYSPRQLKKSIEESYEDEVDKKTVKEALKQLIQSQTLIYTSYGGASYVEVPDN